MFYNHIAQLAILLFYIYLILKFLERSRQKKVKKGRKERQLPDSWTQMAAERRESTKNKKSGDFSQHCGFLQL